MMTWMRPARPDHGASSSAAAVGAYKGSEFGTGSRRS